MLTQIIVTDFGMFTPSSFVTHKLASVRWTRRGRPDRRFKSGKRLAKALQRYERAVCNYAKKEWVAGHNGPFHSPIDEFRIVVAKARLRGLV